MHIAMEDLGMKLVSWTISIDDNKTIDYWELAHTEKDRKWEIVLMHSTKLIADNIDYIIYEIRKHGRFGRARDYLK